MSPTPEKPESAPLGPPSPVEAIKLKSHGLRGTLTQSLDEQLTGALAADDQQLVKFHGIYQQDDRDRREERERRKLERAYSFMVRLRLPGGDISAEQWQAIERIADLNGTGIVKITTRQTVQIHGVVKSKLRPTVQWFHDNGMDSIAACGDVNRNVVAAARSSVSPFYKEAFGFAAAISEHLMPKSRAFFEVWLDGEKLEAEKPADAEEDPLYQKRYLPRKFKIAIAIPPDNDADVLSNDIGLIAIEEAGKLAGFNVAIGGGMGMTHGNPKTYPRIATVIGFAPKEKLLDVVWQIVTVQRDFGNRSDRSLARLKYTVDRMEVEGFSRELATRLGYALAPARPFLFTTRADQFGWHQDKDGLWDCTLFVESGRVVDADDYPLKSTLLEIAKTGKCRFRFTANQNILLTGISAKDKSAIEAVLESSGIARKYFSAIRRDSLACVALNTCPLALAEGQRYLPSLITRIEALLEKHTLGNAPVSIRMTGCPNGCARPHMAEIGLIGRSPGHYNLYLGGDSLGMRLNTLYAENLEEEGILNTLDPLLAGYAKDRIAQESFGDYCQRAARTGGDI